jgi:hypothetical protein
MRKARGIVELFVTISVRIFFFAEVERWLEKEINVYSIQLSLFQSPSSLSPFPNHSSSFPGGSNAAAAVATMAAVLSPIDPLRRECLSQNDSPCVNRLRPLGSILYPYFSTL